MASRQEFTTEEWASVVEAPLLVSVAITASDPSGLWGTLQEGWANASSIVAARSDESSLVRDAVNTLSTSEGRQLAQSRLQERIANKSREEIAPACIAGLAELSDMLDSRAGGDAGGYKRWLYQIGVSVAEAAREGGFLGFGGEVVSEKERATLAEVAGALAIAEV